MRQLVVIAAFLFSVSALAEMTIMSYNVENFFNPAVDSLNPDREYTPNGSRHWSLKRFHRKAEQLASVIAASVPDGYPDIVALNEVEDAECLARLCRKMPHYQYRFIHFDSPDHRGIDVAMLYDSVRLKPLTVRPITVSLPEVATRDILYASFVVDRRDTLHVFACHLPSQLGGSKASQWKRDSVKSLLLHHTDSILNLFPAANIVICGDMNMSPKDDLPNLHNLMLSLDSSDMGSHKYRGSWTYLDQFYVSDSLLPVSSADLFAASWLLEEDKPHLSVRPKRTFAGFKYVVNGYSDHLPIMLKIRKF